MNTGTLGDRVYQTLREQILQGQYEPGQKLNLDQMARELQVSNTPVREAMARLERIGLVEIVPYIGPKVKHLNISHVLSIYDVRIALEELAIRLVSEREDSDKFDGMRAALEMQDRACEGDDPRAVLDADRAFHDALVQASGNIVLLEMLPGLSDRTRLVLELNTPPLAGLDRTAALRGLQGHRRIFDALQKGAPKTAALELRHELTRGKEHLIEQMRKRKSESKGGV